MTLPNFQGTEPQGPDAAPVTPGQEPTPATQQPGYVTREELTLALKNQHDQFQESLNKNYRGVQEETGRFKANVQARIDGMVQAAQKAGIQITPDQQKALETQAMAAELTQHPAGNAPGQGQPQTHPENPRADQVNNAAIALMNAAGMPIEANDPEVKLLEAVAMGEPEDYLAAVTQAIKAKKARMKNAPQVNQVEQGNPAAQIPGLVQGSPSSNPIQNITDTGELWEITKKQPGW